MRERWARLWTVSGLVVVLATGCSKKAPVATDAGSPATAQTTSAPTTKAPEDAAPVPEDAAPVPEDVAAPVPEVAPAEVAAAVAPSPVWVLEGFAMPECVVYDAAADLYYVSNINGPDVAAKDDNGFISKVGSDGKLLALKWIDGAADTITLHGPKGMAIADGTLWVTDIDRLQGFDLKTGAPNVEVPIAGATFMNDIAVLPDEKAGGPACLVATDSGFKLGANGPEATGTAAIWKVCGKEATKVASGEALGHPNGIAVFGTDLAFVGFDATKRIATLDAAFANDGDILMPVGQLDGFGEGPDGSALVSSWEDGGIHKVFPDTHTEALVTGLKGPADFAFDRKRKRVIVPLLLDGKVLAFAL